jgi:hypothetical protein
MMFNMRSSFLPVAGAMLTAGALTTAANAGLLSYVSSTGNDSNPCTLASPCRTLPHAIAATSTGGEIHLIDSAGYGAAIAIGKSITISGDGATIFAGAITINNAGATVNLRRVVLNGGGSAANSSAITIQAAEAVHIENCVVHGFPQNGILVDGANVGVTLLDTVIRDNGSNGLVVNNSPTARLAVDNSRFEDNAVDGLFINSGNTSVSRSVAAGNGGSGFGTTGASANMNLTETISAHNQNGYRLTGSSQMTLESAVARGNGTGLAVFTSATARISNSTFTNNSSGIVNDSGTLLTRRNNTVTGNTTNVSGTLTVLSGV